MSKIRVTLEVDRSDVRYLRLLADDDVPAGQEVASVLSSLASSIADGMRRPGAWEREVVMQLFGDDFTEKLMTDPRCDFYEIPRNGSGDD